MLDSGFFHADPHRGNLLRTPDGRLAYLDFGMMAQVPLVSVSSAISKAVHRTPFQQLGNFLFWITFCFVGQPLCVLLYYNLLVGALH